PAVRGVLRMEELVQPRHPNFLARAARHLAEAVVGEREAAVEVELPDAGDGAIDDRAETLLAVPQRALGFGPLESGLQERVGEVDDAPLRVRALMPAGILHAAARGDGQRRAPTDGVRVTRVLSHDAAVRVHHRRRPLLGELLLGQDVPDRAGRY